MLVDFTNIIGVPREQVGFVSNYDLTAFPPDLQRERLAKNREVEPGSDDDGWDDYDSS